MFTGLVEETARVVALKPRGSSESAEAIELTTEAPLVSSGAQPGDSIAVNGCCLTVTRIDGDRLTFDLLAETLARTNLGALRAGSRVNLERALPANGRLGGHFVQGHIDCTSPVLAFEAHGADRRLEIALPPEFAQYVVFKGSIAVNGISLTVAEVHPECFVLWIIPHTLAVTNLAPLQPGERVNLEFDLLAKYLERLVETRQVAAPGK